MISSKDLFPDPYDRQFIKSALDIFNGTLLAVTDADGNIIYQNNT